MTICEQDNWCEKLYEAKAAELVLYGRALGLSQPTVGRRLAAFEACFGGPALFDRLPEGLRPNAAGEALVEPAERLERAALALGIADDRERLLVRLAKEQKHVRAESRRELHRADPIARD